MENSYRRAQRKQRIICLPPAESNGKLRRTVDAWHLFSAISAASCKINPPVKPNLL
jgi:hypothetical protein